MPERIQLRRTKGWRKPDAAIVVARPSKWGNPYSVGSCARVHRPVRHWHVYAGREVLDELECATKAQAVDWAIVLFRSNVAYYDEFYDRARAELGGHDLACWCPLDQPCHADVLLELANSEL